MLCKRLLSQIAQEIAEDYNRVFEDNFGSYVGNRRFAGSDKAVATYKHSRKCLDNYLRRKFSKYPWAEEKDFQKQIFGLNASDMYNKKKGGYFDANPQEENKGTGKPPFGFY